MLQLHGAEDLYSVWLFFKNGQPAGTYLNFQAAIARGRDRFDTVDYGLDLVIDVSGRWRWKDADDPSDYVAAGRMTELERDAVERSAAAVERDLSNAARWWSAWDSWRPPG